MRAHHFHVIFLCEETIGCASAVICIFIQVVDDRILHLERETAACSELGERELVGIGQFHLFKQAGQYLVFVGDTVFKLIPQFGHDGQ